MPKYSRSRSRSRKRYKRKYSFKQRRRRYAKKKFSRRGRKGTVTRMRPFIADTTIAKMRYSYYTDVVFAGSTPDITTLRIAIPGNSLFMDEITSGRPAMVISPATATSTVALDVFGFKVPVGAGSLLSYYQNWVVMGSKIRITYMGNGTSTVAAETGQATDDAAGYDYTATIETRRKLYTMTLYPVSSTYDPAAGNVGIFPGNTPNYEVNMPYARNMIVASDKQTKSSVSSYMSTHVIEGISKQYANSEVIYRGSSTTTQQAGIPAKKWFWYFTIAKLNNGAFSVDGSENMNFKIDIVRYVKWLLPKYTLTTPATAHP